MPRSFSVHRPAAPHCFSKRRFGSYWDCWLAALPTPRRETEVAFLAFDSNTPAPREPLGQAMNATSDRQSYQPAFSCSLGDDAVELGAWRNNLTADFSIAERGSVDVDIPQAASQLLELLRDGEAKGAVDQSHRSIERAGFRTQRRQASQRIENVAVLAGHSRPMDMGGDGVAGQAAVSDVVQDEGIAREPEG